MNTDLRETFIDKRRLRIWRLCL